jgi:hypothetical protein
MKKQRIEYDSSIDALVAIAKHLSSYESQYKMTSEEFFNSFINGQLEDSEDYIEWANDYKHYRYHFQDEKNRLVFRYDNAPHFPGFVNFPHHKHLPKKVTDTIASSILNVIKEANDVESSDRN